MPIEYEATLSPARSVRPTRASDGAIRWSASPAPGRGQQAEVVPAGQGLGGSGLGLDGSGLVTGRGWRLKRTWCVRRTAP